MRFALGAALAALLGCRRDAPSTPDAGAHAPAAVVDASPARPSTHVCYGAANSAVEVATAVPCESLGASESPPAAVGPTAPR